MKTKTAALMGAAAALTVGPAFAAPEISEPAVPGAASYADLLQPIPNAVERLRIADLQEQQAPEARLIEAQYGPPPMAHHHHHHHHHHHNRRWYMSHGYVWLGGAWVLRPPHHHHHHHHHHHQQY